MVHVFIIPQIDVDVADRLSLSGSKHVVTAGALVEADDGTLAPRLLVLLATWRRLVWAAQEQRQRVAHVNSEQIACLFAISWVFGF